jgi:hypothetical protein
METELNLVEMDQATGGSPINYGPLTLDLVTDIPVAKPITKKEIAGLIAYLKSL